MVTTKREEREEKVVEGISYASPAATILALSALQPIFLFGRRTCRDYVGLIARDQ